MKNPDALKARANALHLNGLLAHWTDAIAGGWAEALIEWEEEERARRSLERRIQGAHLGKFKPICDFEWDWPKAIDRDTYESLMTLDFIKDATNVVLVEDRAQSPAAVYRTHLFLPVQSNLDRLR